MCSVLFYGISALRRNEPESHRTARPPASWNAPSPSSLGISFDHCDGAGPPDLLIFASGSETRRPWIWVRIGGLICGRLMIAVRPQAAGVNLKFTL